MRRMKNYSKNNINLRFETDVFIMLMTVLFIAGTILALSTGKEEILPTFYISCLSLIIIYQGSRDSWNKFRLELFEERYVIYEELLKFATETLKNAEISLEAAQAAEKSFRNLKYYKSQFLFGNDIKKYFDEINSSFAWLSAFNDNQNISNWEIAQRGHFERIEEIFDKATEIFTPYLYFGDVKEIKTNTPPS